MTRMLVAGAMAALLVVVLAPVFIRWLQRRSYGQQIREDGPQGHITTKAGTPTMGGLLILFAMTLPFWAVGLQSAAGLVLWLTTMGCALIGLWDDWMKISSRRSLGLSGRWKMLLLLVIGLGLALATDRLLGQGTAIQVPLSSIEVDLGWWYYPFVYVVLAGAANTVNLTDGIDGLAAATSVISLMAFLGIAFILWERSLGDLGRQGSLDAGIFAAALAGACVGFLWWNANPARIFMGDTGSLALGGAIAALAVVTGTELLLVLIGGIFVIEGLSVIIQVISFKATGRRVFLMAPIHHHFELRGWSETQVMVRLLIVASLLASLGFTLWFRTV